MCVPTHAESLEPLVRVHASGMPARVRRGGARQQNRITAEASLPSFAPPMHRAWKISGKPTRSRQAPLTHISRPD